MNEVVVNQYLSFELEKQRYAVDVRGVREVIGVISITRVPRMPDYMRGVINLRGSVVPVVDLRLKFGLPMGEETVDSCIVILEIKSDEGETLVGAFVDSVHEVVDLSEDQKETTPKMGKTANTDFIDGMGKTKNGFLILLNTAKVFSAGELDSVWTIENAKSDATDEPAADSSKE